MINIAKLLKNCPKGTKLYSPLFGEVKFKYTIDSPFGIVVEDSVECSRSFDKYGRYFTVYNNAECLLFPSKDCRTWENFKLTEFNFKVGDWIVYNNGSSDVPIQIYDLKNDRYLVTNILGSRSEVMVTCQDKWRLWTIQDAKDGDILVSRSNNPFIYNGNIEFSSASAYVGIPQDGKIRLNVFPSKCWTNIKGIKPATKEQHDLLFQKIKEVGYEWNKKKKELRKIINPKFKVGDWIANDYCAGEVIALTDDAYLLDSGQGIPFSCEHNAHLWTIQDAKEGDVITNGKLIVIFKKLEEPAYKQHVIAYIGLDLCGRLQITEGTWQLGIDKAIPATKEQRDLLFAKMKEAGYQWDSEKKELRNIISPKFQVGKWIAYNKNRTSLPPKQIIMITGNRYIVSGNCAYDFKTLEADWHLWTIADAKKGDILYSPCCKLLWIYKDDNSCYVGNNLNYNEDSIVINSPICIPVDVIPATTEQCDLLLHKIDENGYVWDENKKELLKIIEPIFKVGDEIFRPACNEYFKIKGIEKGKGIVWYVTTRTRLSNNDKRMGEVVRINVFYQNEYSIVPKSHYDISNFKPFDKVLVRSRNDEPWRIAFYGYYNEEAHYSHFVGTCWSKQCIPFNEDTKHLLGTTDMCPEEYINW